MQVAIKPHHIFQRDGKHLQCEVPINFVDAALGGELEVPTLDGRVKLKIPPETQTGKLFRLRGKGVKPVRGGMPGDLLCKVVVETPSSLTTSSATYCASSRRASTTATATTTRRRKPASSTA